jgi:phage terminase large subunit GpA-like protein
MDCLSPMSPIERVVFMKAAQLGATEMGSNWIGYVIHHAPGSDDGGVADGGDGQAQLPSSGSIALIEEIRRILVELIARRAAATRGNTILAKEFRGGVLVMTGANSAVGLRSMPVRYLFLDEVDGYPLDVEGEGDAISLAEARTRTFARRKIFIVSTPTICRGQRYRARVRGQSDQRRYFVPCPHCAHRQWLRFEQLRWDKGQPETAAYICESCDEPHCRAPQDLDAGARRVARDDHQKALARRQGSTCHRCTARWAGAVGASIAAAWEAAVIQGIGIGLGHQDLQEHRAG